MDAIGLKKIFQNFYPRLIFSIASLPVTYIVYFTFVNYYMGNG